VSGCSAASVAGPYSHGVVANGFLYTAGFGPQDPATGLVVEGGVAEQTRQVFRNIGTVLAEYDLTFDDVVKVAAHLEDLADFAEYNTDSTGVPEPASTSQR
jgi:2-iminobutanoate/2-iminopropanoate deaminase